MPACARGSVASIPARSTPASPAANSTVPCSVPCRNPPTPAATTASSTPSSSMAPCSANPSPSKPEKFATWMASSTPICCVWARAARYDELVNMALIAVSGHPGCRFEEVARFCAQRLGFELLTQSRVAALAGEEFGADAKLPDKAYPSLVTSILARLATQHHLVFCAAGGELQSRHFPGMLRVHVVAPENIRIGNLMLDRRLERPAARQLLLDLEAADRADRKAKFGKTKATAELFDLVLNAEALTTEQMAGVTEATVSSAGLKERGLLSPAAESTLRVDVTLLNRMMNLVGELVLTRNQVLQATSSDPNMTMLSRRLDMVTADLRESVMKARMQPVSNIFSKMPRIVRDLSQSLGRRVRLQVEGQDTELDKSLLEAIKDPLTHAVRNSLDHGIELPEVRQTAGKDPEGTLKLRASHEGSHVIIEVSDDGAGIAVEKVRQKAIERGVITPERAAQLGERELLQLVFLPGFSTAAAVTNVSGRGVGMDVVRTNVEKIGGTVEIDSRTGKGTTLRLRIPLTLAIIPALIVRSVNQSFALPQGSLSELVHIPPEQAAKAIEWMEGAPLYRLRGKLLPLVFLDQLLMPGGCRNSTSERDNFIAVLDADGRRFGLVVDGLADPEEIVVKPLSAVLKDIGL